MGSRRWIDTDNLAKIGGGLVMVAVPVGCWYLGGFTTRGLWILGALGIMWFFWGLLSIGDIKNDWE